MNLLLVILGGGLGSGLRYLLSGAVAARFGESFPWGTLLVNVTGSLAIGIFATFTGPDGRWLICANMPGNSVVVFRIDPQSGGIKEAGEPVAMPSPSCIRLVP